MNNKINQTGWFNSALCRLIPTLIRYVLSFSAVAYYLVPDVFLRLGEPGWWLMDAFKSSSATLHSWASVIFCLMAISALAFEDQRRHLKMAKTENLWSRFPSWLPFFVLCVPMLAVLVNQRQNADIAPAVCSTVLAFSTGVIATLLAKTAKAAITIFLVLVVIQAGFALYFRTIFGNVLLSGSIWREGGTFNDPNALSVLAVSGSALAFVMFSLSQQQKRGLLYGVAAAISLAALLVTWSRGGAISLGIALVWFSIRYVPQRFGRVVIALCMCLLVGLIMYNRGTGSRNSASAQQSVANRFVVWVQGVEILEKHWLTGIGVGPLIIRVSAPTSTSNGNLVAQTVNGPKNVVLYFMDELGVIGMVLLALAFTCIHQMLVAASKKPNPEAIALSTAWIALMLYSFIDTTFGGPRQYYGNAIVGYLYASTVLLAPRSRLSKANLAETAMHT